MIVLLISVVSNERIFYLMAPAWALDAVNDISTN